MYVCGCKMAVVGGHGCHFSYASFLYLKHVVPLCSTWAPRIRCVVGPCVAVLAGLLVNSVMRRVLSKSVQIWRSRRMPTKLHGACNFSRRTSGATSSSTHCVHRTDSHAQPARVLFHFVVFCVVQLHTHRPLYL